MPDLLHDPLWLAGFGAGLLVAGLFAGLLAGLLGVGGGIVIVPVLFHVFTALEIDPAVKMHLAVGTSLATIIPTSITSARAHHGRGAVDLALLRVWGPALFLGVVAGAVAAGWLKGAVLTTVFAVLALAVAANMAFGREDASLMEALPSRAHQWLMAFLIGGASTLMGIGGGTLTVPVLSACRYPIRRAVGTAAAIGMIISIPGALGFLVNGLDVPGRPPWSVGYVNLAGMAVIVPATMLTAPWGARLAHTMSTGALRRAFAVFLALTAVRMIAGLV